MKLIKLSADHYIIVDDSEIKEGDCITDGYKVWQWLDDSSLLGRKKIVYSTEPIEYVVVDVTPVGDAIEGYVYGKVQELSLSEVKELIGEVDVEKKAEERYPIIMRTITKIGGGTYDTDVNFSDRYSYKNGYNQALEDNKDRKYTDENVKNALFYALYHPTRDGDISITKDSIVRKTIQSLQPPTSWDVEFVDGKLKIV